MTSEVVVMNGLGIALASDSAASVSISGRSKLYQADKLFMLSHHHPVGAMIYGNPTLLGVPWETIFKMFRRELGDQSKGTLVEYGQELIRYLSNARRLFPEAVQQQYYLKLVETLYSGIQRGALEDSLLLSVESGKTKSKDGELYLREAKKTIENSLEEWRAKNDVECFDPRIGEELATKLSDRVQLKIQEIFKPLKLSAGEVTALRELAVLIVSKEDILTESMSGLVIAGYGEDEHFPVMQSFELGEIFLNHLKYEEKEAQYIDSDTPSIIQPFAEADMVETFLNGISASFELKMIEQFAELAMVYPESIINKLPRMTAKKKEELKNIFAAEGATFFQSWRDDFETHKFDMHSDPISQSIAFLPKNELAHVAASLVNLNSFQKRMSIQEDETVGGPIDVAVISKGDGFVWIERKHYFKPELNRHFFKNYGIQTSRRRRIDDDQKSNETESNQGGATGGSVSR